jgi:hypothetical protein
MKRIRAAVAAVFLLCLLPGSAAAQAAGGEGILLVGYVVDAATRRAIPSASVEFPDLDLTLVTDGEGRFSVTGMRAGTYAVRVRHLGYGEFVDRWRVDALADRFTVALGPRPIVLEGITAQGYRFAEAIEMRRRRTAVSSRVVDRRVLQTTGARDGLEVLATIGGVRSMPCPGGGFDECARVRGGVTRPVVYIDDMRMPGGLPALQMYPTYQLFAIEIYQGGQQVRAYTTWWVEGQARRNRRLGSLLPW